jgi:SAM-dependent methyltransferase
MDDISDTGAWRTNIAPHHHGASQELAHWIVNYLAADKNQQIHDLGCGPGEYLLKLREAGFTQLTGYEADPPSFKVFDPIIAHDLTKPLRPQERGTVICLEVGEHIPASYESALLDNMIACCYDKIILSWAVRGQGGHGHVNCLDNHEVVAKLTSRGFTYLADDSRRARNAIAADSSTPWFRNTIMIFSRKTSPAHVKPALVVVDDFLPNPDEVRMLALRQSYTHMGSAGKRSLDQFHTLIDPLAFESLLQERITDWNKYAINGRFQFCTCEDPIVYHSDSQNRAGVIFLTPDAPIEAGLTLVRSRVTGARRTPQDAGTAARTYDGNLLDRTKWDVVDRIANIYNRLVLWDAQMIHAAASYFGTDIESGRLFWMFFFDGEPA